MQCRCKVSISAFFFIFGSDAGGEVEGHWRASYQLQNRVKGPRPRRVAGKNESDCIPPMRLSLTGTSDKSMTFLPRARKCSESKIELASRPGSEHSFKSATPGIGLRGPSTHRRLLPMLLSRACKKTDIPVQKGVCKANYWHLIKVEICRLQGCNLCSE